MALAALIVACRQVEDGGERLCATLPLAGRTLIEHQARLAARAGAGHVVILVERLPPALTGAVDRLRRDGLKVEIARSPADAADRIHPEEALLLIGDGCLPTPGIVARIADGRPPAVLTVPDTSDNASHERIDATARWGGLLLIDGARLRSVTAMLGEWDMELTVLRAAVQEGAARITFDGQSGPPYDGLQLVRDEAALEGLDRAMLLASREPGGDWPSRLLFPLFEKLAVPPLLGRGVDPIWLSVAALASSAAAAPLAFVGWLLAAYALLLLGGALSAIAARLAATRLGTVRHGRAFAIGRVLAVGATLLALAYALAATSGWGVWIMALLLLLAMAGIAGERLILARLPGGVPLPWIATLDGLIWACLPFAVTGYWLAGMGALALYALLSAFALQREVLKRVAVYPGGLA